MANIQTSTKHRVILTERTIKELLRACDEARTKKSERVLVSSEFNKEVEFMINVEQSACPMESLGYEPKEFYPPSPIGMTITPGKKG